MEPEKSIIAVQQVFHQVPRPNEFIWGTCYCSECVEHNQTLAAHTPDTITLAELGNAGWDPMCFASHQAFRYYLPAMIRLAFETEDYISQFLFHLTCPDRIESLTLQEAQAVLDALWVLAEIYENEVENCGDTSNLEEALQKLEDTIGNLQQNP